MCASAWTSSSSGMTVLKRQCSKVKRGVKLERLLCLRCPSLTCGGAPGQAGRPAAVAPAGDHAGAAGGVARSALDGDAVPGLVERPRGSVPKGPRHIWRGTRHICGTDKCPVHGFHGDEASKQLFFFWRQKMFKNTSQQSPGTHLHRWEERSTSRPACTRPRSVPSGSPPGSGTGPRSGRWRTDPRILLARRSPPSEVPRSQRL